MVEPSSFKHCIKLALHFSQYFFPKLIMNILLFITCSEWKRIVKERASLIIYYFYAEFSRILGFLTTWKYKLILKIHSTSLLCTYFTNSYWLFLKDTAQWLWHHINFHCLERDRFRLRTIASRMSPRNVGHIVVNNHNIGISVNAVQEKATYALQVQAMQVTIHNVVTTLLINHSISASTVRNRFTTSA